MAKKLDIRELLDYLAETGTGKSKLEIIGEEFARKGSKSDIIKRMENRGLTQATFKKIESFMEHGRPVKTNAPADLTIYATRDELHSIIRELEARIAVIENAKMPVEEEPSPTSTEPPTEVDPLADLS